jgi:hypothetical protein
MSDCIRHSFCAVVLCCVSLSAFSQLRYKLWTQPPPHSNPFAKPISEFPLRTSPSYSIHRNFKYFVWLFCDPVTCGLLCPVSLTSIVRFSDLTNEFYRADCHSGNALYSHSRYAPFESLRGHWLSWLKFFVVLCSSSPCGGGLEYFHCNPANRRRRWKGNLVPGGITGSPCHWGI